MIYSIVLRKCVLRIELVSQVSDVAHGPLVILSILLFTLWLYTNNWSITECKIMTKNSTISFPITHINVVIKTTLFRYTVQVICVSMFDITLSYSLNNVPM